MNRPWVVVRAVMASVVAAVAGLLASVPSSAMACFIQVIPRDDQRELSFCTPHEPTNTYQDFFAWGRLDQTLEMVVGALLVMLLAASASKLRRREAVMAHADTRGPDRVSGEISRWLIKALWQGVRYMTPGTPVETRD